MKNSITAVMMTLALLSGLSVSVHARPENENDVAAELFERHCRACHSKQPPPKTAPPVQGIASHYRKAFSSKEAAVRHMVRFMQQPDAESSILGEQAVTRFGLMPVMSLNTEELRRVAAWLWDQYDPAFTCK